MMMMTTIMVMMVMVMVVMVVMMVMMVMPKVRLDIRSSLFSYQTDMKILDMI